MADRSWHKPLTQGVSHVTYNVALRSYGATHPVFIEGDAGGTSLPVPTGGQTGSYLIVQRGSAGVTGASGAQNPVPYGVTGTTGSYILITRDPFVALVTKHISLSFLLPDGNYHAEFGQEFKRADGTFVLPFKVFQNAAGTIALADLPADPANRMSVSLTFRNSSVKP